MVGISKSMGQSSVTMKWLWLCAFCICSCVYEQKITFEEKTTISEIVDNVFEIDTRVSFGPDSSVAYSQYMSGYYNVYKRRGEHLERISYNTNGYYPFFLGNKVGFLSSPNNDSHLVCNLSFAGFPAGSTKFQWIYSLAVGRYLVFALEGDNTVYLFDFRRNVLNPVYPVSSKFNGCAYSSERDLIAISVDDKLLTFDPKVNRASEIKTGLDGEKVNPSFFEGKVYFCSNSNSEFFRIYCADIDSDQGRGMARLIYQESNSDVRMPKLCGSILYFISVSQSRYLLKKLDLSSGRVALLTQSGVVYDFFPTTPGKIMVVFAGPTTPRCLGVIDSSLNSFRNLTQPDIGVSVAYSFISRQNLAPAYYLNPKRNKPFRGIVLFFRPGIHGDFSPRWDTTLISLCELGYMVVAPNFSGSIGYGKTYFQNLQNREVDDMVAWIHYLRKQYPKSPLYCLAFSSGNRTMEAAIVESSQEITAAASFSGTQSGIEPASIKVPTKYFLGDKDPIIDVDLRHVELIRAGVAGSNIRIIKGEGHWIVDHNNIKVAILELAHFYQNSK